VHSTATVEVFLFALLTAVATGIGALPFAFVNSITRRWLGASNALAAGLMLAAGAMIWMVFSELLPDALKEASGNLVAVIITLSVLAMLAIQVLTR
jgi:zinc transporter ZupT